MKHRANDVLKYEFSKRNWGKAIGISPKHAWMLKDRFAKGEMGPGQKVSILEQLGYEVQIYVKPKL